MQPPTAVRLQRLQLGLTLDDVEAATKIAPCRLSCHERGVRGLRPEELERLHKFYAKRAGSTPRRDTAA
jgi:hypothetical protein